MMKKSLIDCSLTEKPHRKREILTALIVVTIFRLKIIGSGTGIKALIQQDKHFNRLRAVINVNIKNIENSITHLLEFLSSRAEVVLQNRKGLDLVFLQQRGL